MGVVVRRTRTAVALLAVLLATLVAVPAGAVPGGPAAPGGGRAASSEPAWSSAGTWWRPRPVAAQTWQWQLSGRLDLSVAAAIYDVDAVETTAAQVRALHARGRKVICYVNAGAYESWRPDRGRFPGAVLGRPLDGWAGERWLDIRRWDVLKPIMTARFRACRSKGFDGVEPDNVDGYANRTGFPLSASHQLRYNRRIAALAHSLGLAVGLKNDVDQAAELAPAFDFAVNEECAAYDECGKLRVFVRAGKPVFHVEYARPVSRFCRTTTGFGFTSMRKREALGVWRQTC
jgi:hypothetical protein